MKNPVRSITALSAGVVLLLAAFSCELPPLYEVWGDFKSGELEITPSFVTLEESKSVTLTVSGGRAPYSYLDISGDGILTPLNGHAEYTAPALGADDSRLILITDSKGNQVEARILVTAAAVPLLRISPTTVYCMTGESVFFTGLGGKPDYVFSLISGDGTINAMTGEYSAPISPTAAVVRVKDSLDQTAQATVIVSATTLPPLVIDPTTLIIPVSETFRFSAAGGEPPYFFSASDGTIVLASPTTADFTAPGSPNPGVTVTVTDSAVPIAAVATATITVVAGLPLAIVPRALTIGKFKSFQFEAAGGSGNYRFDKISGYGSITPEGLYTASNKLGTETVKVTDTDTGVFDTATITVKAK